MEWARTVEDVLARRTRALFLDAGASAECAAAVSEIVGQELQRGQDWKERQARTFMELAGQYQVR